MSASLDTIQPAQTGAAPTSADPSAAAMPQVQPGAEPQPAPPQDEFQFRLPTGSVYRDVDSMVNGVIEKDLTIERLKGQLAAVKFQPPAAPAPQPQNLPGGVSPLEQEIYQLYKAQFPNYEEADLRGLAKVQAMREQANQQLSHQQQTAARHEAEYAAVRVKDPRFDINTPGCGKEVFEEFRGLSPAQHYRIWKAEQAERGQSPTGPAAAAAGYYSRGYNNIGGPSAAAPRVPQGSNDPYVNQAVEAARARGVTDPGKLEAIRNTAIESSRFIKR